MSKATELKWNIYLHRDLKMLSQCCGKYEKFGGGWLVNWPVIINTSYHRSHNQTTWPLLKLQKSDPITTLHHSVRFENKEPWSTLQRQKPPDPPSSSHCFIFVVSWGVKKMKPVCSSHFCGFTRGTLFSECAPPVSICVFIVSSITAGHHSSYRAGVGRYCKTVG